MSIKTKAGQLWTDSVAYVALLAGAGLSIAGNVANVLRTRGALVDTLDIVLAVAFPALVVLMVEVFVSARWKGLGIPMQILRWLGTLSIGAVAMRVSWVHLNELMLSRGQAGDVATFGPLAIDALAIMATALILAGRGRAVTLEAALVLPAYTATQADADASEAVMADPVAYLARPSIADEASSYLDRLGAELDSSTTAAHPISPAPMTNTVKRESVPELATDLIHTWADAEVDKRPKASDVDALLAGEFGVSTRTARRWRDALLKV